MLNYMRGATMNTYEVYLITNKINNKKYVGQTISSRGYLNRFDEHIQESISTFDSLTKEKHSKTYTSFPSEK